MKKSVISAFFAFILVLPVILVSCGTASVTYASDVPVSELVSGADRALGFDETLTEVPADYIKGMMEIDTSAFSEYAVKIRASGANIDEYGIFKAPEGTSVADTEAIVRAYLDMRLDIWMEEYMPEEKPKLEKAEIKIMGDYVIYCILDTGSKDAVFNAMEALLIK